MTKDVVPRIIAAQRAEAAFADLHFSQTSMVLTGGKTRADEMDDLAVANEGRRARCARPTVTPARPRASRPRSPRSIETWKILDDKLYAAVKRGDTGYAEQTVAGYADAAADNVITAIERYITQADLDRARPTRASPRWRARPGARASSSACWRCWPRWASPSGSRATSAGACAPSPRPPRRSPRATSTTS